jgi:hypothetical protein
MLRNRISLFVAVLGCCAATALLAATPLDWPREKTLADGTRVTLFQPQIDSWELYAKMEFHLAAVFTLPDAGPIVPGVLRLTADTTTDFETRTVVAYDMKVAETAFPSTDPAMAARLTSASEGLIPQRPLELLLDRVLAHFEAGSEPPSPVEPDHEKGRGQSALRNDAPVIIASLSPALLVLFDGEPLWAPIEGTDLEFALNTNWQVFRNGDASRHFLLNEHSWLEADDPVGPWRPAGPLPDGFGRLPEQDVWVEVRKNIPGAKVKPDSAPWVVVSYQPAELIVIAGTPQLEAIEGTQLAWISNTESDLFWAAGEERFYFLVSGRWFRGEKLDGPWSYATIDLPEEFSAIPLDHPRTRIRASVPGTPEAQEAMRLAQIPRKAEVTRDDVSVDVTYDGDPKFEPIEGTSMAYAANTSFDVIRYGDIYYTCFQGIWFVSTTPNGPWLVTDAVPDELYTIPPECPKHHVTYVYVYDSTPDVVVYGYTSGYWGVYVHGGVVVYGTGWYYPSYWYYPPHYAYPIYYPRPYSYGAASWYNPYTGSYGRGAVAYGPFGGYGWGSTYNPHTGAYTRGAAAWGPYQGGYRREGYNPSTDTYAARQGYANPYEHWGESVVSRGDEWVHGGHYGDERGTVGAIETSKGGKGVGYSGDEGRGFVAKDGDNNVYAGRDGNVYRNDGDGWSKYENGDWNTVDPSQVQQRAAERGIDTDAARQRADESSAARASGEARTRTERSGERAGTMDQLQRDRQARDRGNARSRDYNSWRSGGSGRYGRSSGSRGAGGRRGGRRR